MRKMNNRYKLYQGDCLEVMDRLIEEGVKVDAIITDPPYGTTACKWDSVIPFEEMWDRINKLIKPNGAVVLFGNEPFTSTLICSNIKNFKYKWTWYKSTLSNHLNAKKQPLRSIEDICIFYKKQPTYNPQLRDRERKNIRYTENIYHPSCNTYGKIKNEVKFDEYRTIPKEKGYPIDILDFQGLGNFGNKRVHPTQKPVELLEYLIKTYTNEGELVLDFTMGSGSTGVAALNTNRRFIGIELDEKYFNIAKQRIKEAENNQISFKLGEEYE